MRSTSPWRASSCRRGAARELSLAAHGKRQRRSTSMKWTRAAGCKSLTTLLRTRGRTCESSARGTCLPRLIKRSVRAPVPRYELVGQVAPLRRLLQGLGNRGRCSAHFSSLPDTAARIHAARQELRERQWHCLRCDVRHEALRLVLCGPTYPHSGMNLQLTR